ncbi:MAG: hypothetical protein U1F68_07680 [Gammaproteobacteria bacterium]
MNPSSTNNGARPGARHKGVERCAPRAKLGVDTRPQSGAQQVALLAGFAIRGPQPAKRRQIGVFGAIPQHYRHHVVSGKRGEQGARQVEREMKIGK